MLLTAERLTPRFPFLAASFWCLRRPELVQDLLHLYEEGQLVVAPWVHYGLRSVRRPSTQLTYTQC